MRRPAFCCIRCTRAADGFGPSIEGLSQRARWTAFVDEFDTTKDCERVDGVTIVPTATGAARGHDQPFANDRSRAGQRVAGRRLCSRHVEGLVLNMQLASDGFTLVRSLLSETECDDVSRFLGAAETRGAGSRRLLHEAWCADLACKVMAHPDVREALPARARAVQCTFFEKSVAKNWLVPIHQDLSIPVSARVDHPALSGWSDKEGAIFVQAPDNVLEQMLAVRVHVDHCSPEDGPLRVVPGSHEFGRVEPAQAAVAGRTAGVVVPAKRGDALLMRPLVLHASSKSSGSSLRRVLHFVFGPDVLPYGLAW